MCVPDVIGGITAWRHDKQKTKKTYAVFLTPRSKDFRVLDRQTRKQTKNENGFTQVWPEWIYSQVLYFEPRAGGEVRIFGFYNNKQINKKNWEKRENERIVGTNGFTTWSRKPKNKNQFCYLKWGTQANKQTNKQWRHHSLGAKSQSFLVVKEIDCGDWLTRGYMPAHQLCKVFTNQQGLSQN